MQIMLFRNIRSRTLAKTIRCYARPSGLEDVVILGGARTPIGSFLGQLSPFSATDLGALSVAAAVKKANIEAAAVEECFMGLVLAANTGSAPAKQAALRGGLHVHTPCTALNKLCASGMKAIMLGAQGIQLGQKSVICAGGMESMSNAPFFIERKLPTYGGMRVEDCVLKDALIDPKYQIHMGQCVEKVAERMKITRAMQDDYAIRSYKLSLEAATNGSLAKEIEPVKLPTKGKAKETFAMLCEDEEPKRVKFDKIPTLREAFTPADKGGSVTAANASSLNDGAAACIIASASWAAKNNAKPLARIIAFADGALDPMDFAIAPAQAVERIFAYTGLKASDIDLWEINEAFAAVVLANVQLLGLDLSNVNLHGGAVSCGHPVGMSGTRITNHLAYNLKPGQKGMAAICNAGGGASAILIEGL